MYLALYAILLLIGIWILVKGFREQRRLKFVAGGLVILATVCFFWFMNFWGEMLWFDSLGYGGRFWTVVLSKAGFFLAGALFGYLALYLLTSTIAQEKQVFRTVATLLGGLIGGFWGSSNWDTWLLYLNRAATSVKDPILHKDTAFYLFTLPLYDSLYGLLLLLILMATAVLALSLFLRVQEGQLAFEPPQVTKENTTRQYGALYAAVGLLLLVLAWGKYLNRFHLMYSTWGAVVGPGWTDVKIRLPAYAAAAVVTALLGVVLLVPPLKGRLQKVVQKLPYRGSGTHVFSLVSIVVVTFVVWFVLLSVVPHLFQWLKVEPNELSLEEPYIAHNIAFTRRGFRLHQVEEREFPAAGEFGRSMVERNPGLFENIRLWDWRALDSVLKQFQEIRLYYEFKDVDVDRYTIGEDYRQVMVSPRELRFSNLPSKSQTFVNRHFIYTHGYGITLTPVSEFTPEGLPDLLVKDIPPKAGHPDLVVERPEIYYGELSETYVIGNSKEQELDYPSGEENVYVHYQGKGGVPLSNLWRKFLYGWKFGGTRFFLSGYPTRESRILFHRQIEDRIKTLAPFLHFDEDPYIVLAKGKLYWIVDAYTLSADYPYSEPLSSGVSARGRRPLQEEALSKGISPALYSANYIRNAVKVVIDAYDGAVDLYVFDPEDPLVQTWQNIFPHLFKKKEKMPKELLVHVRYPSNLLVVQGLVYAKYHMTDPDVFYNQEDLWIRATEKYYGATQPVDPYYIMWKAPEGDDLEFIIMMPFTPKNRQVLIGWIAGMCDGEDYGRFLAYKFPKEKRILGTQQVETKIDQDPFLSGQLSLWDQRGSKVIRGNVLVIPVEETLLYVEPIYLEAETAAYPELRIVAVMYNDVLSYGESFDEALQGLFKGEAPPAVAEKEMSFESLVKQANEAFSDYLSYLGEKQFARASEALERLQEALQQLSGSFPASGPAR